MLNKHIHIIILFGLLTATYGLSAQSLLSVEEAVGIALKNNYDVSVARNNADVAKVNNTLGNAGMLPNISVTGTDNYSVNNVYLNLSSGSTITSSAGTANAFSAGAALSWTLFDGTRMFITKNKLTQIEKLGEIQFRDIVIQTVYNVTVAFYQVVVQKQQLLAIRDVMAYSLERVKILQKGYDMGIAHKNDLLQAKIDLNVNREAEINQLNTIRNSKRALNQLITRDPETEFEVVDTIPLNYQPDPVDLMNKLYINNTSVLSYQKQVDIERLSLGEYKTYSLPKLNLVASYNYQQNDNTASNVITNRSFGPLVGGSLIIPVYQAGNVLRQVRTAKIQLQSSQYNLDNVKLQVNTQLKTALTDYEDQRTLLGIERNNLALAKENLSISMERLRLGQTTALEVRQAQESYANSLARYYDFEFNMKVTETRLKQLIADL
ncbi:MAG: TolC family protein [Bacteroidales bacterium]|jgi:outer membrane protein TolC|nr:TolC family protein [Bacteroidales bacterium]